MHAVHHTNPGSREKHEIAVVAKVTGIPWFTRMEVGVNEAAKKLNVNAYQVGPATPDPAQQVKVIEDLIAKMSMPLLWCRTMPKCWAVLKKAQEKALWC